MHGLTAEGTKWGVQMRRAGITENANFVGDSVWALQNGQRRIGGDINPNERRSIIG